MTKRNEYIVQSNEEEGEALMKTNVCEYANKGYCYLRKKKQMCMKQTVDVRRSYKKIIDILLGNHQ